MSGSESNFNKDDDELTIPRAAMNKMIKELCPNVRVSTDARELVLSCCTEFIHLISSEANEVCASQQKKTINPEHVLVALEKLGYGDFKADCEEVLNECKDVAAKRRRQSTRLENLGIPEEELFRQQQELFARARAAAAEQELLMTQQQQQANSSAIPEESSSTEACKVPEATASSSSQVSLPKAENVPSDDEDYS